MRETGRKILHLVFGLIVIVGALYLHNTYSLQLLEVVLLVCLIASLLLDFLVADFNIRVPIVSMIERENELTGFHGSTHFLIGILVALQFFPFDIALAAIAMLVFGDSAAALVGRKWGVPFYRKKSLHGMAAMFIVSVIAGFFFLSNPLLVVGMAIVATIVEVFIVHLDDNLMIPVFTALAGFLLRLAGL